EQSRMSLAADKASDLLVPNPISVRDDATVQEAVALLIDKGISGAPVINEAGAPVGIVSNSDILIHDREIARIRQTGESSRLAEPDQTRVRDIMTPVVFSVAPDYPARKVVAEMLALKIHRVFVIDRTGILIGVISALDVLRHLQ